MSAPDDANDLRGEYLRRLLRRPRTRVLIAAATIGAGLAAGLLASPLLGLLAALGVLGLGLGVAFGIADKRAAEAFFSAYSEQRGLREALGDHLPEATPLLRKGDKRYANVTMTGALDDGVDGTLALYTYEETTSNGKTTQTSYRRYTLGLIEVPECARQVPELYCQRKFGLRALERFEDLFRGSKERVRLESEALQERYEIFATEGQDPGWLRELFSPTFIVWLTDSAPQAFAFELVGGTLCCYVKNHREDAAGLDEIRLASVTVAKRLREESSE